MLAPLSLALVLCAAPPAADAPAALTVSAGYLGEFVTWPGAFFSLEWPLLRRGSHALVTQLRLGGSTHPGHHTGLVGRLEAGYRFTASFGLYGEVLAAAGAYHGFLAGPVYEVNGAKVTVSNDLGRLTFLANAALGVGWQFENEKRWPDRVFLRADGWLRTPVNGAWLPGFAVSVGVSWTWGGAS